MPPMSTSVVSSAHVIWIWVLEVAAPSTGVPIYPGTVIMVAPPVFGLEYSPQPSALYALAFSTTRSVTTYW